MTEYRLTLEESNKLPWKLTNGKRPKELKEGMPFAVRFDPFPEEDIADIAYEAYEEYDDLLWGELTPHSTIRAYTILNEEQVKEFFGS